MKSFSLKLVLLFLIFNCSADEAFGPISEFISDDYNVLVEMDESSITVTSKIRINKSSFTLNGIEVPLDWEYSEYLDDWYSYTGKTELDTNIHYTLGKDYNISLNINDTEYNSTIHLPVKPVVNWPELIQQSAFSFSWQLLENPLQQTIYISITVDDFYFDKYWYLDGDARSHIVKKEYLEKFKCPSAEFWIRISCVNRVKKGRFVVNAESFNSYSRILTCE